MENYDEFLEDLRDGMGDENDFIELVPEILNILKSDDLMFFQYAEGGAMGEPGGIYLLMRNKQLYHTNYLYGHVTIDMLKQKFDAIREFKIGMLSTLFVQETEKFASMKLGFGNSLFVNKECLDKFCRELENENIKRSDGGKLYKMWISIAKRV